MKEKNEGSGSAGSGLGDQKIENIGSESAGSGLADEIIAPTRKISVVFPYFKEMAQGNEILFAMRALAKNFREAFQIVVIGDKEDWFSDEVIFIPSDRASENPQIDTLNKLKLAIADERVSDGFIWMNDDIYMISPVMLADIQILTAYGKLANIPDSKKVYDINRNLTINILKKLNYGKCQTHNYDTHTPFYFEKEKLVMLFEEVPKLNSDGLLVPSIYFNVYFWDHSPMQIDNINGNYMLRLISSNTDKATFDKFVAGKKFLNNSEAGFNKVLINYLQKNFAEKSIFEK